ncbi:MAG: helix-turn-helix transcriptional regulator [Oscillospiraceae bacterium]|nr:helix-turn-helix transcriptional regulator [Oscillospiraceae bacterium]
MADAGIAKRLKQARDRMGLTQEQVCEKVGIPKSQTLSSYETGKNSPPIEILKELSRLYQLSIDWIVWGEDQNAVKQKDRKTLVEEFFTTLWALGLSVEEDIDWNNNPNGKYIICLNHDRRSGFLELVADIVALDSARSALDDDDYETLVKKRIAKWAEASNGFELKELQQDTITFDDDGDDNDLPF